jgi:hypothetical protein
LKRLIVPPSCSIFPVTRRPFVSIVRIALKFACADARFSMLPYLASVRIAFYSYKHCVPVN